MFAYDQIQHKYFSFFLLVFMIKKGPFFTNDLVTIYFGCIITETSVILLKVSVSMHCFS